MRCKIVLLFGLLLSGLVHGETEKFNSLESLGEFSVGADLFLSGGVASPGLSIVAAFPVAKGGSAIALYLGAEAGANLRFTPSFAFLLPLTGKIYAKSRLTDTTNWHLGVAAGALIGFGGGTSTSFLLLFEPALEWVRTSDFLVTLEPRLGLLGGSFVFAPRIGVTVPL